MKKINDSEIQNNIMFGEEKTYNLLRDNEIHFNFFL